MLGLVAFERLLNIFDFVIIITDIIGSGHVVLVVGFRSCDHGGMHHIITLDKNISCFIRLFFWECFRHFGR
jgi:hypothetical protein